MSARNSEVVQNKSYLKEWDAAVLRTCISIHETRLDCRNLAPDVREKEEKELARIKAELVLRGVPMTALVRS